MSKEFLILLMVLDIISILTQKMHNLGIVIKYSVIDYINDMLLPFGKSEEKIK